MAKVKITLKKSLIGRKKNHPPGRKDPGALLSQ